MVALVGRSAPHVESVSSRFDEVFRSNYARLYSLVYRLLGDRGEAEDTLQEVFLKAVGEPVIHRADHEVSAWLRRACLNAGYNRLRSQVRQLRYTERAGRLDFAARPDDQGPLLDVLRREQQDAVRRALRALPERQRTCLLLRHSGYSYAEIAATLGMALGSVGVLLARGEQTFKDAYQAQEGTP
jgi:RNA polymerase sigma-70 factor (ECF subfamily)